MGPTTSNDRSLLLEILAKIERDRQQAGDWDSILTRWEKPASDTEEATIERAARMVRGALDTNPWFQGEGVIIAAQGSYHNNTNVRQQADMDIRVVHPSLLVEYAPNVTPLARLGLGYTTDNRTIADIANQLRVQVGATLRREFGAENVNPGNKAFRISAVPGSRSDIDVVPALAYDHVVMAGSIPMPLRGIVILPQDGGITLNFPEQHHRNGVAKRERTAHRFKKVVRTVKSLRDRLIEINALGVGQMPSFLIECLVYRVEDEHFLVEESRHERLRRVLRRIEALLAVPLWTAQALEINDVKLLFGNHQGWTATKVQFFVRQALAYLEIEV